MGLIWEFERTSPRGGSSSGAWRNPLASSSLPQPTVLAREAIQNSADAQLPNDTVRVRFTRHELPPVKRADMAATLRFHEGPLTRLDMLGLQPNNLLDKIESASDQPSESLLIEDFGTMGLGGRLTDGEGEGDRFRRLVFVLGAEGRMEEPRGGSFGFGKTVYSGASNIRTVVYYSVFEPSADTENAHARLFAASFFGSHRTEEEGGFTGRAWFGVNDEGEAWPLIDDDAHEMAEKLGIRPRQRNETGASILVLGSDVTLDDLRKGIEEYWWPRLLDNDLEVSLYDGDREAAGPAIRSRPELRPYIHCYEMAVGRAQPDSDGERLRDLGAVNTQALGKLAMTRVEPADANDDIDEEEDESPIAINRICVMRRPRMVVQYAPIAAASEPVASVVVADDAIDGVLRFSEPPPHDEWQHNNPRLSDIPGGASVVRILFRRAKQEVRQFQSALAPVPPTQEFDSLRNLERMLTDVFGGTRSSRRPPPPRSSDPFQITIAESREGGADGSRVAARCAVSLKDSAPVDEIDVTATLRASVLTDDNARVDEHIEFESLLIGGHPVAPESVFPLRVVKNEPVEIIARSVPFDSEWQAQVSLDVSAQSVAIPPSQEQTE